MDNWHSMSMHCYGKVISALRDAAEPVVDYVAEAHCIHPEYLWTNSGVVARTARKCVVWILIEYYKLTPVHIAAMYGLRDEKVSRWRREYELALLKYPEVEQCASGALDMIMHEFTFDVKGGANA